MQNNSITLAAIQRDLKKAANPKDAVFLMRFFRTGPGQYGAGDRFLGIRVPQTRELARQYETLPLKSATSLLRSPWHEARLLALLILIRQYQKADRAGRAAIHRIYLTHTRYINNWDLVDLSAPHIIGAHLRPDDTALLERLARSRLLWDRRIAMVSTYHWIRRGEFRPTLRIAGILLHDEHDLIHKAVGWMLREVGKRDQDCAESFLRPRCRTMPRTALRYAIERFPPPLRQRYLKGAFAPRHDSPMPD